jgi:hypothetical protein
VHPKSSENTINIEKKRKKEITPFSEIKFISSIYYRNKGTSSSVNDVDHYAIIKKLLDSIFHTFQVLKHMQDSSSVRLPTQRATYSGS